MGYRKQIICLANSRKMSGRCIAGLEVKGKRVGGWIRPVSSRDFGETSIADMRFEDGAEPKLLDVLEIPFLRHQPRSCQSENHLIDAAHYWVKVGEFPRQQLSQYCESPDPIWINGFHSYNGTNDRIPEAQTTSLSSSLMLVEPQGMIISVERGRAKKQVRAQFHVAGQDYKLTVTDPVVERKFLASGEGQYAYEGRVAACLSIGEPFEGYCYKLVASIIDL